jgi:hypothetical protein
MKEPLPLKKPPLGGNSRAERRGFERKMRVSQLWIHKEVNSRDQFIFESSMRVVSIPIVPFDLIYSHFGKYATTVTVQPLMEFAL